MNIRDILEVTVLLFILQCNSIKSFAQKRDYLNSSIRIDTIKVEAQELNILDTNLYGCLDLLLKTIKKKPEFRYNTLPLFFLRFGQEKKKAKIDIEANNGYATLDIETLLGEEDAKNINPVYEAFDYHGYKFIVNVIAGDSAALAFKQNILKNTTKKIELTTYRFYSKSLKRAIELPMWYYEVTFQFCNGNYEFVRKKYHPHTEPLFHE